MKFTAAASVIAESKYKMTRARESILHVVLALKMPFTAHDVLARFKKQKLSSQVDLATIYRNLPVFEELGLICKSDFSDEVSRYMVAEPGHDHHHHHIVCRSCAKVVAVDACALQVQEKVLARLGFTGIRHRLEFTGVCRDCA